MEPGGKRRQRAGGEGGGSTRRGGWEAHRSNPAALSCLTAFATAWKGVGEAATNETKALASAREAGVAAMVWRERKRGRERRWGGLAERERRGDKHWERETNHRVVGKEERARREGSTRVTLDGSSASEKSCSQSVYTSESSMLINKENGRRYQQDETRKTKTEKDNNDDGAPHSSALTSSSSTFPSTSTPILPAASTNLLA